MLDHIIGFKAQTSALQAIQLSNLMQQKWVADPRNYVILSQLTNERDKSRLNDLTSNRYHV